MRKIALSNRTLRATSQTHALLTFRVPQKGSKKNLTKMAIKKNIQNEERSKCLWGILCTKFNKIPRMLKKNWSPEEELILKSDLNLKQKIVHRKNTSKIFLSSLLVFFTDNDVVYLDLWNALSWIQQIWGQFCLAFIEKVYLRKKIHEKKTLAGSLANHLRRKF